MYLEPNETILRRERIHADIFALPVLLVLMLLFLFLVIGLIGSAMISQIMKAFAPFSPRPVQPILFYLPILVTLVPVMIASLFVLVSVWVTYLKSQVTLTNKRLIFQTGFIMRISGELPLENGDGIFLVEPVFGRLLGYGTVTATSLGGAHYPLRFIGKPQAFHAVLQKTVYAAKMPQQPVTEPPMQDESSRYMPKLPKAVTAAKPLSSQNSPSPATHDDSRYMPKG